MYITHTFPPLLSLLIHLALCALYAVSIHAQAAPDMSSKSHPQSGAPWYITKSCGPPVAANLKGYCMQAKGAFAVTVLLWYVKPLEPPACHHCNIVHRTLTRPSTLFLIYTLLSIFSLIPTRAHRSSTHSKLPSTDLESTHSSPQQQPWEMSEVPRTPGTTGGIRSPTTPRTMAFNTLSGKGKAKASPITQARQAQGVQLRHHISMGEEVYQGPAGGR